MKTLLKVIGFVAALALPWFARAQTQLFTNVTISNNTTLSGSSGRLISVNPLSAFNVASGVTPFVELEVDSTSTSSPRGIMTAQFSTGTDGARFHMRKARGTRASPTTVVTGDNLGRIVGTGYDGTSYLEMANILFGTEGTIATNRVPTFISFSTATNAATSVLTQAFKLDSSQNGTLTGNLTFGTSASILNGTTGSIGLTATGTNQSITLTPSGTGVTNFQGASLQSRMGDYFGDSTYQALYVLATATASGAANYTFLSNGSNTYLNAPNSSGSINFRFANVTKMMLAPTTGNLLLGGLTTDDTVNTLQITGGQAMSGKINTYNNLATTGNGVVTVQGVGRATAQTAANASVATYTVGASDASFVVSANVLVTTSGSEAFTVTVTYTDESNTSRTLTLNFSLLAGTLGTTVAFANGAVPYEGVPAHIRCKASTAITVKAASGGTYTGCTYNVESVITKLQ